MNVCMHVYLYLYKEVIAWLWFANKLDTSTGFWQGCVPPLVKILFVGKPFPMQ